MFSMVAMGEAASQCFTAYNPSHSPSAGYNPAHSPNSYNPAHSPTRYNPAHSPNSYNPAHSPNSYNPAHSPNSYNPAHSPAGHEEASPAQQQQLDQQHSPYHDMASAHEFQVSHSFLHFQVIENRYGRDALKRNSKQLRPENYSS